MSFRQLKLNILRVAIIAGPVLACTRQFDLGADRLDTGSGGAPPDTMTSQSGGLADPQVPSTASGGTAQMNDLDPPGEGGSPVVVPGESLCDPSEPDCAQDCAPLIVAACEGLFDSHCGCWAQCEEDSTNYCLLCGGQICENEEQCIASSCEEPTEEAEEAEEAEQVEE